MKYENHQKQQKEPYVIYADFESIIEVLPQGERGRTEQTEKNGQARSQRFRVHGSAFGWQKLDKERSS